MYAMEKSLRNAAVIRRTAAISTAPKLAMPARRAVSPNCSDDGRFLASAKKPARKEYPLNARASRRTKLPNSAMMESSFFQNWREQANEVVSGQPRRLLL